MPATIAGSHLGPDIHANRPAANTAGQPIGAQYSCTTHGLIYISNGSAWSTYATLGGAANLAGVELDYAQVTSPVSVTASSEASADTVVTGAGVAYDGSTVIMIEAYAPFIAAAAGQHNVLLVLYDGSSSIGILALFSNSDGANLGRVPTYAMRRLTPSNATHTYSIRAFVDSGTGTVQAGAGGSGNYMPAFMRITRVA